MTITFSLLIDGQEVRINYKPDYIHFPDLNLRVAHIEFLSPHEPSRRIPVSETGYRSHFAYMSQIEAAPSLEDYIRAVAQAIMNTKGKRTNDNEDDQLSLFPD
jgi:hypothetical protein